MPQQRYGDPAELVRTVDTLLAVLRDPRTEVALVSKLPLTGGGGEHGRRCAARREEASTF